MIFLLAFCEDLDFTSFRFLETTLGADNSMHKLRASSCYRGQRNFIFDLFLTMYRVQASCANLILSLSST